MWPLEFKWNCPTLEPPVSAVWLQGSLSIICCLGPEQALKHVQGETCSPGPFTVAPGPWDCSALVQVSSIRSWASTLILKCDTKSILSIAHLCPDNQGSETASITLCVLRKKNVPQHEDQRDKDAKKKTGCYAYWSIRAGLQGPTGDLLGLLPACSFRQPPERERLTIHTHTHTLEVPMHISMYVYIYEYVKNKSHILCLSLNAWLDLPPVKCLWPGLCDGLITTKVERTNEVCGHHKMWRWPWHHLFTFVSKYKVSGGTKKPL